MDIHESLHRFRKLSFKRQLRHAMTPAEQVLWGALRNRKLEATKWRRQANIDVFIADFLCPEHRLIVEIDGGIHESQQEYDCLRTEVIASRGYRVIRFSNTDVLESLPMVLKQIVEAISDALPQQRIM